MHGDEIVGRGGGGGCLRPLKEKIGFHTKKIVFSGQTTNVRPDLSGSYSFDEQKFFFLEVQSVLPPSS